MTVKKEALKSYFNEIFQRQTFFVQESVFILNINCQL